MSERDQYTQIAPNYTGSPVARVLDDAMRRSVYTYRSDAIRDEYFPEVTLTEELRNNLNYVLHPEDVQQFTRTKNTPLSLMRATVAAYRNQRLESYLPKDTLGKLTLLRSFQDDSLLNALVTVTDIETITSKDAMGNEKTWIYNAAFNHVHKGGTIGAFKKDQFQHFFVGIYDNKELDYLQDIANIVEKNGVKGLNHDQKVTFEFLSRLGASISDASDIVNKAASDIKLTEAAFSEFGTVHNFRRATEGLRRLGTKQLENGVKVGDNVLNSGIAGILDNLAEIIANEHSLVTGWNVNFDVSHFMSMAQNTPGAEQYLRERIAKIMGADPGRLPDDLDISRLRRQMFDPYQDVIRHMPYELRTEFLRGVSSGNTRQMTEGMGVYQFENIAKGMAANPNLPPEIRNVYALVHHLAGPDVAQEGHFILDPSSPFRKVMDTFLDDVGERYTDMEDFSFRGLLFQAQDSGSMQQLLQYNRNVFATVKSSNGNVYMSNGWKYDSGLNKFVRGDQFIPGAWSQDMVYETTGMNLIRRDSDLARGIAYGNPNLAGEDLVQINYRVARSFLRPDQLESEAAQEIRTVYMPQSMYERQLSQHIRIIGYTDKNGRAELNQYARDKAARTYKKTSRGVVSYKDQPTLAYWDATQQKLLDRAERSFTKHSLTTNENAFLVKDILEQGTFTPGKNAAQELQAAILAAAEGKTGALEGILKGTTVKETAEEIAEKFYVGKSGQQKRFSNAWLSNTLTISESIKRGSLFEQLHRSAIDILNTKEYQTFIKSNGEYAGYTRNMLYSRMMDEATDRIMELVPGLKDRSFAGNGRPVNEIGKFYLNAASFARGYRSENYVYGAGEDVSHYWMRIDLENPYGVLAEVKKAAGLSGRRGEDMRIVRRNLISFTDYMSKNTDLTEEERKLFGDILDNNLRDKNAFELSNDLTGAFKQLKNRVGLGWAPDQAFIESQSKLTRLALGEEILETPQMKKVIQSMWDVASDQKSMFTNKEGQRDLVMGQLSKVMGASLSTSQYEKYLTGYDAQLQSAMRAAYGKHIDAMTKYSKKLVNSLYGTGIAISVGDSSVYASYGKKTIDITGLLPKLRSNDVGILSWMIGNRDTTYTAGMTFGLNKDFHLTMDSTLGYLTDKSFINMQSRLRTAVEEGENPLDVLEWYIKKPNEMLRQAPPIKGTPAGDLRNMLSGSAEGIFADKERLEHLVAHSRKRNLNETQERAIASIEKYLGRWKGFDHPLVGQEESEALINLIYGEDSIIGTKITNIGDIDLFVNAGAKQTGSDQMRLMFAEMPSLWEFHNDPGKMVQNQLDNALYLRTNLTKNEQRILDDGRIQLSYGPRLATRGEQKLSQITSGRIGLANRIQMGVVEANDRVKAEIMRVMRQNYENGKVLADVFGSQFMPYEGGGWINSRIWDTIQNPVATQMRRLNGRETPYIDNKIANLFHSRIDLQFDKTTGAFTGYGRGVYVKQDDALWGFYSRFLGEVSQDVAKRDSILSMAYITRDGRQIVDADTLRENVAARLKELNIENATQKEWVDAADSLYDRSLVARRVFDEGFLKAGADTEKHISVSGARAIAGYTAGVEEQALHDIFYSDEFNKIIERNGIDFRSGGTLTADLYYDMARMDFSSSLFRKGDEDRLRSLVRNKMRALLPNAKSDEELDKAFYQYMDKARHRISDMIDEITHGGKMLASSMGSVTSHGNVDQTIKATINWLERQMMLNQATTDKAKSLLTENFQRAVQILEDNAVLRDHSGRAIKLIDPETGQVVVQTNHFLINDQALREVYKFTGSGFDKSITDIEADKRMNKALSVYRDIEEINGKTSIYAHLEDVSFIQDTEGSDKLYKITDREINSYTNTLWDQKLVDRLHKNMSEEEFRDTIGRYVENGQLKKEFLGRSIYEGTLNRFFNNDAFVRYDEHRLTLRKGDELIPGRTGKDVEEFFDNRYKKMYGENSYRAAKTAKLVNALGEGKNVSVSYAEDLYEVASLQQAAKFNLNNRNALSESGLLSDVGNATNRDYFKRVKLEDVLTSNDAARDIFASGEPNIFRDNLLIDLEDESLGLTRGVLNGRSKIALAGVSLSKIDGEISPTGFQSKLASLQNEYRALRSINPRDNQEEYDASVKRINNLIDDIIAGQSDYAAGKIKSSKTVQLAGSRIPASLTNKVQVIGNLGEEVGDRTYNGKRLADLYKTGQRPNVAFVGEKDLEKMGFNDGYFKKLEADYGITKSQWLNKMETEGFAGSVHRWPSDYWGSTMQVQVYLDRNMSQDTIKYDDITAAFLKADADGDYASAMLHTAMLDDGTRVDLATAQILQQKGAKFRAPNEIAEAIAEHRTHMSIQAHDLNKMVLAGKENRELINKTYDAYIASIMDKENGSLDTIAEFMKKNSRMDLTGNIHDFNMSGVSNAMRQQYLDEFGKYRGQIESTLASIAEADEAFVNSFKNAKTHEQAAGILQERIGTDRTLRNKLYQGLGENAEAINDAFAKAASVDQARLIALQRVARKGVGLADTPYTAIDFLRMSAIGSGRAVLSNEENTAMFMVKELSKEQLLTPKKMTAEAAENVSKNLAELGEIMDKVIGGSGDDPRLKQRFIDFMENTARKPSSRYEAESLLKEFAIDGTNKIDSEKLWGSAYEGIRKSVQDMRANSDIFDKYSANYMSLSRFFKGRIFDAYQNKGNLTYASFLGNAIAEANGIENMSESIIEHNANLDRLAEQGELLRKAGVARGSKYVEKVAKNYKPGKGLALSALGLAAAAVFGGYAGGNPATPTQQQAQNIQEQNPPPRTINLADSSLTASGRKQPGYVININAQTERDKEYASRLITQAVTKNFQDTNVNVSMNVNQQPGNISGNDLMDYLTQALY